VPAPFVFMTTYRIREGRLEEFTGLAEQYLQFVEAHEPDMVAHFIYLDKDGTEVSLVQVHAIRPRRSDTCRWPET
jgi:hypothetical protein